MYIDHRPQSIAVAVEAAADIYNKKTQDPSSNQHDTQKVKKGAGFC
jgi:hypothetical protein